ncbi:MAG: tetratricopeptide repeat protein [Planctomycetes bacterium]|nr:tetratricopeptide repeat protein [Planctomycetota bacterium]
MSRPLRSWLGVLALASVAALVPAPRSSFAGSLKPDGRTGTVTSLQGVAYVRPVGRERWTPLDARGLLLPGDVVRTEARGAHALDLRLAAGARVVVGPGALLETKEVGVLRLLRGDAEVVADAQAALRVEGPGGFSREAKGTLWLRATDAGTTVLDAAPRWLVGYRASTSEEWMGSLLATVDGKNVALSVGYHKVTVEVRDQIARTTVEESFVNATDATLEGQFSFPLPADASISGFSMWIGDEMVEADLVEKQRARAIYEDILRRKKDPGLLEWEGGNLFKARVFPIFPHSEKRVRIRYTQVLPLEGEAWRYRYALRSELLRLHPLRELSIAVNVLSAAPIRDVSSPTHAVTLRKTEHEAVVEFSAQQYVPERDFEVAVDVGRGPGVSAVAHRRGEDGFFMLLVAPPDAAAGGWQRDLVPEGDPLDLVLVADTSGSMDPAARATQAAFLAALLGQCGAKDRFRLLACDVEPRPLVAEPTVVTEASVAAALAALDARVSLGWTDLEKAFDAVAGSVGPKTQVVYVGDGVPTSGDADPVATAGRLKARLAASGATVHAVSTSSSYEKGVLDALASVGGGSVRRADGGAAAAAKALLAEVARPGLRDARVEVKGVATAKVYPEVLPNLPLTSQQVVLGRYLPTAEAKAAEVVVTGTVAGKPVRFTAPLTLPAAEEGNSFLPRLWARSHLDVLLAQGRSPETEAEVVAFSREYQIMTPYTSFLVLESDEDRERYGVERTVKMRDAERFFADARDRARLEVARQQSAAARRWRLELRRQALAEIGRLGRDLEVPTAGVAFGRVAEVAKRAYGATRERLSLALGENADLREAKAGFEWDAEDGAASPGGDLSGFSLPATPMAAVPAPSAAPAEPGAPPEDAAMDDSFEADADLPMEEAEKLVESEARGGGKASYARRAHRGLVAAGEDKAGFFRDGLDDDVRGRTENVYDGGGSLSADGLGFPALGAAVEPPKPPQDPAWDAAVVEALKALDRRPALAALDGAVRVEATREALHPLRGTARGRTRTTVVASLRRWWATRDGFGAPATSGWLSETERVEVDDATRLGRKRAASDLDRGLWPLPLQDGSLGEGWLRGAADFEPPTATRDGAVLRVVLRARGDPRVVRELDLDVERHVALSERTRVGGRVTSETRWSDFVEAGGRWWARKTEHLDDEGRVVVRQTVAVEVVPTAALDAALAGAAQAAQDVVFLGVAEPTLLAAQQADHDGRAGLAERLVLALDATARGRFDAADTAWATVETMLEGKPGRDGVRLARLVSSRRGTVYAETASARVAAVVADAGPLACVRAEVAMSRAGALGERERLALERALSPVFARAPKDADLWSVHGRRRLAQALESASDPDAALEVRRALAADRPFDLEDVLGFASALRNGEDLEGALREVAAAAGRGPWTREELAQLHGTWAGWLWEQRDLPGLVALAKAWVATKPTDETPWQMDLALRWFVGDVAGGDAIVREALSAAPEAMADPVTAARVRAGVYAAAGQGWNLWLRGVPEAWHEPLAAFALRCLRADGPPEAHHLARWLMQDWRFRPLAAARRVGDALRADLLAPGAVAAIALERLAVVLPFALDGSDEPARAALRDALLARWRATAERDAAARLVPLVLATLPQGPKEVEALLAFRREVLARAGADDAPAAAAALFEAVLRAPFSTALEDEAFGLLVRLRPEGAETVALRGVAADATRRLAAWLHEGRFQAALGPAEARAKDTRAEAARRTREARARARTETAARFLAAAGTADAVLRPWLELERVGYAAETLSDLARTEGEAKELLEAVPAASDVAVDRHLGARCAVVLAYAATRRTTPEGLADRVLAYFRARLAAGDRVTGPRGQLVRLLLALDRPEELEQTLLSWIRPDDVDVRLRTMLAYVQAERGDLRAAATTLEAAAATGELAPDAWTTLAGWYLVLGEDARREQALDRALEGAQEWQLQQGLWQAASRVQRRGDGVPEELDPESIRALRHLLQKSPWPQNHVGHVANLYAPTKDFRLLEALADGVAGHSPEAVYGYLEAAGNIVGGVFEEATCDALVARVGKLLENKALTDVDRRALRLLLVQVEARATAVPKADPVHAERALVALRAAAEGAFAPGERVLFARRLAQMGTSGPASLVREQLVQLEALLAGAGGDPLERLAVGRWVAQALWDRARPDDAIDRLDGLLAAVRAAVPTTLSPAAGEAHPTLVGWWLERRKFRAAEARLRDDVARESRSLRRDRLRLRLFEVYARALEQRGATALGQGGDLFAAAAAEGEGLLTGGPAYLLGQHANAHAALFRAAAKSGAVGDAGRRYAAFVSEKGAAVVRRDPTERLDVLQVLLSTLADLAGPRPALTLALDEMDRETAWHARAGWEAWPRFHHWMATWRRSGSGLADLEARLLPRVLAALERWLLTDENEGNEFWWNNQQEYWREKTAEFRAVAAKVAELHADEPTVVLRVAGYQRQGQDQRAESVETLRTAIAHGKDPVAVRWTLAQWLVEDARFADAWPVLERLVKEAPDAVPYLVKASAALHGLGRDAEALALLEGAATRWKDAKRWNAGLASTLATAAMEAGQPKAAAAWIEDALRLRREAGGGSGPDGTLSSWYQLLARARSALGDTDAAVKAASAAVVAWGRSAQQRQEALDRLREVVAEAKDLDGFVARYEAEVAASGLDAPAIRKAVGRVYLDRGRAALAAKHLAAVRDLDPADAEAHTLLVRALDTAGDAQGALDALLASLRMAPKNLAAYPDLASRYERAQDAAGAERARTSLVEAMPAEADGHRALAQLREQQKRFDLAVERWRQVVRIRSDEPEGWLSLAAALLETGDKAGARTALDRVLAGTWDERFGDVKAKAAALLPRTK